MRFAEVVNVIGTAPDGTAKKGSRFRVVVTGAPLRRGATA